MPLWWRATVHSTDTASGDSSTQFLQIWEIGVSALERREEARVEKRDGCLKGPYQAIFAGDIIMLLDPQADVEIGDTILRRLPSGRDERSVVTKATYFSRGIGSIGAHYQVEFRPDGESPAQRPHQSINITGAQAVQIGDYNTQSIVNSFETLLGMIESADASSDEKAQAKSLLGQLLRHPLVVSIVGAAAGAIAG